MADPRFDTNLWTHFEYDAADDAPAVGEGSIENASSGGVFIRSGTIPDRGERVWISFDGPRGERVAASGVVWWTTGDGDATAQARVGFGVRLVASSGDYRRLLRRLSREA